MKKILLIIFMAMFTAIPAMAEEHNLTFLYINGSNNNDTKMKDYTKSWRRTN